MNNGILPQGLSSTPLPCGLLGAQDRIAPMPDSYWHPEAADWMSRVRRNGGEVNSQTMRAVSQFCAAVESAGIRDRFFRLNLFCGNSDGALAAVRTPLFRGPRREGTQYGNTTDTNVNFVSGDYTETGASGGLTGNGSTKSLQTGVRPDQLPAGWEYDLHISAYRRSAGNTNALLGSYYFDTAIAANRHNYEISQTGIAMGTTGGPISPAFPAYPFLQVGVRSSSSSSVAYVNSTAGTPYTTAISAFATGVPFTIFARNLITGTPPAAGTYQAAFLTSSTLGGYSIGASLTASQVAAYSNAMTTFQAAMGRT